MTGQRAKDVAVSVASIIMIIAVVVSTTQSSSNAGGPVDVYGLAAGVLVSAGLLVGAIFTIMKRRPFYRSSG